MATYRGGPCDGKRVPAAQAIYGEAYCGNVKYTLAEDGDYHALTSEVAWFGVTGVAKAQHAWANMNRALGHDTDRMIKRLQKASARMRRAVQ